MLRRVYPGGVRHTNGGRYAEGGAAGRAQTLRQVSTMPESPRTTVRTSTV